MNHSNAMFIISLLLVTITPIKAAEIAFIAAQKNIMKRKSELSNKLFQAIKEEKVKKTEKLIEELFIAEGTNNLDVQDEFGYTALGRIVAKNNIKIIKQLLTAGANVNIPDKHGNMPLMHTITNDDSTSYMIEELIKAGADLNIANSDGKTALMFSVSPSYRYHKLKILLGAGANVNAKTKSGKTALMMAVEAQLNHPTVEALLDAGADWDVKDSAGKTAFSYANEAVKPLGTKLGRTVSYRKYRAWHFFLMGALKDKGSFPAKLPLDILKQIYLYHKTIGEAKIHHINWNIYKSWGSL